MSYGVGHRGGLDLVSLWLWRRPVAAALIRLLVWELPYASALKRKKKKEEGKLSSLRGVHTQLPQVQVWWSQVLALLHPPCWEI